MRPPQASDPLPRIGPRLVLRRLRAGDLAAFQAYRSDEAVGLYQGWTRQTDAQAIAFIEAMSGAALFPTGEWVQLAVADRESDQLVGDVGICVATDGLAAEIGFTVSPRFQGRGLGREALLSAIGLVFERSAVEEVVCITDARNNASIRLLECAGLRRVATAEAVFRGEPCIEHTYKTFRACRIERDAPSTMSDSSTCLFCRIARGDIPSHRVHESEHAIAFLDIRPIRRGHVLVVPREHFAYFDDLRPEVAHDVMRIAQRLAPALRSSMGVERVGLFFTGVDIAHAHAHVVPMVEPTDITSPRYIAETPLTFGPAPLAPTEELQDAAKAIRSALGAA